MIVTGCIMGLGMHLSAWRARDGEAQDYVTPDYYTEIARSAERAKLHGIFLADTLTNAEEGTERPALGALDPSVLLSYVAARTERVGLIGTASTSFNEPFDLARRFLTLDLLSRGRAAWNLVTTFVPAVAENFGEAALADRGQRYARAEEFVDVVRKLWESWEPGALVGDKGAGIFADPDKVHRIDFKGSEFSVAGPMTIPRRGSSNPLIFQAGSSEAGRNLAARTADVVFTAQNLMDDAIAFRDDMRRRTSDHGRSPDSIKIVPGLMPILGETRAEAEGRKRALDDVAGSHAELVKLGRRIGIDPQFLALDEKIPVGRLVPDSEFSGSVGFRNAAVRLSTEGGLTVRELLVRNGGGHLQVVGSAVEVADVMEQWYAAGAADGFNLMIDMLPSGMLQVEKLLVPELVRRGLFRTEYRGDGLREDLGL